MNTKQFWRPEDIGGKVRRNKEAQKYIRLEN
jgi:hypothetical protein